MKILKNKKVRTFLIGIVVFVLAIIVILNLFAVKKELSSKKIKNEDIYLYFGSEKFEYKGNITLDHENSITNIQFNNKDVTLFSEPIYFAKKEKIILPVAYSVVNANIGLQNKVGFYTEIVNRDGYYYLLNKDLDYKLNDHFLYDGEDMYIFIQPSTVSFQDKKIEISPLSFVNYLFNTQELYIYDYKEDKVSYYEQVTDNVIVSNENYKINLSSDNIIYKDKEKLLMKNFDYLKKLK